MSTVIQATALTRVFERGADPVIACAGVDIELREGELVVVRGPSGAGKTTLLSMLGLLDRPTSGTLRVGDVETTGLDEEALAELRRTRLGFVFQSSGLLPVLSAAENVELPLRIARIDPGERGARVREALAAVGLEDHAEQRPAELSGGQQQRVGIARAIVTRPSILIADEPTGQLDSTTAGVVMDLIHDMTSQQGIAAVVATHDPLLAARADRVIDLRNGHVLGAEAPTLRLRRRR